LIGIEQVVLIPSITDSFLKVFVLEFGVLTFEDARKAIMKVIANNSTLRFCIAALLQWAAGVLQCLVSGVTCAWCGYIWQLCCSDIAVCCKCVAASSLRRDSRARRLCVALMLQCAAAVLQCLVLGVTRAGGGCRGGRCRAVVPTASSCSYALPALRMHESCRAHECVTSRL